MSANFSEFWNIVVGSTGELSDTSVLAIRAAMEVLYNANSPDARAIIENLERMATIGLTIDGVERPAQQLTFLRGLTYSSNISDWRITISELLSGPHEVKMFNILGVWTTEPLWRTLAHELSHLVLGTRDPVQLLAPNGKNYEGLTYSNDNPDMDLIGGAEEVTNRIASAITSGFSKETVSYYTTQTDPRLLTPDIDDFLSNPLVSYTYFNPISNGFWIGSSIPSVSDYNKPLMIDRSGYVVRTNDLLIGGRK